MKEDYLALREKEVIKANELIQKSRFNLSLAQQKIVLYLISQISPYDEEFKEYEFDIIDFCKVCGIYVDSGKNYADIKASIKEIADKSIWLKVNESEETLLRWIEKARINKRSGMITIRLDDDMKPFLLQLKRNFTRYELIYTLYFKSKYTIRLYELIVSIHFHELEEYKRKFNIDELKALMGAESYKEYRDFKRRALVPSVEEINRYSDKNVSFEEIKNGKKVIAVELTIATKETIERLQIESEIHKALGIDDNQLTLWDEITRNDN